jgi:hypothetical protein
MKLPFTIIILFCNIAISYGCCAAGQYKIYPLGYSNEKLIVAEFQMSRSCENGDGVGKKNEFEWNVLVSLCHINADTTVFIKNIDTLSLKECTCSIRELDQKSELTAKLLPAYRQAIKEAKKLAEFKNVIPESYSSVSIADTLSNYKFIDTDTTSEFYYKGKLKELEPVNWGASGFLRAIQEVRTYRFGEKKIVIVNLCAYPNAHLLDRWLLFNKQNFKSIETAITYTPTHWHGQSNDYIVEY